MTNAWFSMNEITESITKKLSIVESKSFVEINTSLCGVNREVGAMLDKHKNTILKDEWLVHQILAELRAQKRERMMQEIADARIAAKKNRSADDEDNPMATLVMQKKVPALAEKMEEPDQLKFQAPAPEVAAMESLQQLMKVAQDTLSEKA